MKYSGAFNGTRKGKSAKVAIVVHWICHVEDDVCEIRDINIITRSSGGDKSVQIFHL